jgi:GDP-L-fucose synthase
MVLMRVYLLKELAIYHRQEIIDFRTRNIFEVYDGDLVNIDWGKDLSIKELALLIASVVRYEVCIQLDSSKPNGLPCKLLDISTI